MTTATLHFVCVMLSCEQTSAGPNGSMYSGSDASAAASDCAATPPLCPSAMLAPDDSALALLGFCAFDLSFRLAS